EIGFEMPDAWVNPMPSGPGFVWDVAGSPDPNNGHAVAIVGYNSQGVQIATWGMIGTVTWAALKAYCATSAGGNLYTAVSADAVNKLTQTTPAGLSLSQMVAD